MKKIKLLILGILFAGGVCVSSAAEKGFYFYSPKDVENIKATLATPRGKEIFDNIVLEIEARREHSLELPKQKSGRGHWFLCNTHNITLKFDFDKPNDHWCSLCKEYLKGGNLDAGWVKHLHFRNETYLQNCMWAYMASGDKKYAEYIRDMLMDYAKLYPTFKAPTAEEVAKAYHLSRMWDQWLDDCVWLTTIAPAYIAVKDIMTDAEKAFIIDNLFTPLAEQQMNRDGNNNWQVWNNCGRIHLGIVLEDEEMIDIALNGKKGLRRAFEKEVNADGWYNEAAIGYHLFPLKGFWHAANALLCRGENMFDAKFEKMFTSMMDAAYPDMKVVAHNDGNYGSYIVNEALRFELAYARMPSEAIKNALAHIYSRTHRDSAESLLNPGEIKPISGVYQSASTLFPQTGFAVLRDGKNSATMTFGVSHGGHGHPHRLAVTLHNGKKEILPDFGTPGYGSPMYRPWYQKTLAHNTVTVDGKDHRIDGLPGKLIKFDAFAGGGAIEASADKAYADVKMSRKVELKNGVFTDEFKCSSMQPHVYDYVLQLRDKPEFEIEAADANWTDAPPFKFIKNQKSFKAGKSFKIKTATADIEISSAEDMEVLYGVAPGPVVADAESADDVSAHSVVIRTRANDMNIKANWIIK